MFRGFCFSASLFVSLVAIHAQDEDILLRAMWDELDRSMSDLRHEDSNPPYFVAYTVEDVETSTARATLGSSLSRFGKRERRSYVEVRVGDYEFDNTNWIGEISPTRRSAATSLSRLVPLGDDYDQIRRVFWDLTDQSYKAGLKELRAKTATSINLQQAQNFPDFSSEEPLRYNKVERFDVPEPEELAQLAERLSRMFAGRAFIHSSSVYLKASVHKITYVNSEGTTVRTSLQKCILDANAVSQAENGREFHDFEYVQFEDCVATPIEQLESTIASLVQRLQEQLLAEKLESYDGPVLLEGKAVADVLNLALLPKLVGTRVPLSDRPTDESKVRNPFLDKLGSRVLTRSLSVRSDPTVKEFEGIPLVASYEVDAEGVRAQSVSLIERGVLKSLLTSRKPVADFSKSTGSNRGRGAMPSNVFFEPHAGSSIEAMQSELLKLARERGFEYGVVVRRLARSFDYVPVGIAGRRLPYLYQSDGGRGYPIVQAYKLYADGREVPITGASISNFSTRMLRDILAVSHQVERHDVYFFSWPTGMTGFSHRRLADPLVSMIVPSLLFERVTLKQTSQSYPRRPFIPSPLARSRN